MLYGHIETMKKLRADNPKASDEALNAYEMGRTHRAYKWARQTPTIDGDAYDRGFDGLEF